MNVCGVTTLRRQLPFTLSKTDRLLLLDCNKIRLRAGGLCFLVLSHVLVSRLLAVLLWTLIGCRDSLSPFRIGNRNSPPPGEREVKSYFHSFYWVRVRVVSLKQYKKVIKFWSKNSSENPDTPIIIDRTVTLDKKVSTKFWKWRMKWKWCFFITRMPTKCLRWRRLSMVMTRPRRQRNGLT